MVKRILKRGVIKALLSEPTIETPGKNQQNDTPTVKGKYSEFDTNRPPLNSEANAPKSIYPDANEAFSYEMEKRIFDANSIPQPPEDPNLRRQYEFLKSERDDLERAMTAYKDLNVNSLTDDPEGIKKAIKYKIKATMFRGFQSPKEVRHNYFNTKRRFLLGRKHYLKNLHQNKPSDLNIQREYHESELIGLSHLCLSLVKSACHTKGSARRKSGKLVIRHCYRLAMTAFNEYKDSIEAADSRQTLRNLYKQLISDTIVKILHDYIEDFAKHGFDEAYLRAKISEFQTLSHTQKGVYGASTELDLWDEIEDEVFIQLNALNKGSETEREAMNQQRVEGKKRALLEPHIEEKLLKLSNPELAIRTFIIKVDDRIDNLYTLDSMTEPKQEKKIAEAKEMLTTAHSINRRTKFKKQQKHLARLRIRIPKLTQAIKQAKDDLRRKKRQDSVFQYTQKTLHNMRRVLRYKKAA